jgi:hypothetical protein
VTRTRRPWTQPWWCWPVPHIAVPFRSDMAAVAHGAAAGCPARPAATVSAHPRGSRGCPRCRSVRLPVSGRPRPVSARPDSRYQPAASTCPHDQRRRASTRVWRCRGAGTAAVGPPPPCRSRPGSRTPWPVSGWLRNRIRRTPWLSAAASGTTVGVRTVDRCPDGWCPPRTPPQPAGVRCYRKRSPGRRRLDGCRHCR